MSPSPEQLNEMLVVYMGWKHTPSGEWLDQNGDYAGRCAPDISGDLNLMYEVEERLLAEGKGEAYGRELDRLVSVHFAEFPELYTTYALFATADPLTRARAVVATLGLGVL